MTMEGAAAARRASVAAMRSSNTFQLQSMHSEEDDFAQPEFEDTFEDREGSNRPQPGARAGPSVTLPPRQQLPLTPFEVQSMAEMCSD